MVKYGKHRHLDIAYIECLGDGFTMIFVSFIIFRQYFNSDFKGLFECFRMVDLLETRYFHIIFQLSATNPLVGIACQPFKHSNVAWCCLLLLFLNKWLPLTSKFMRKKKDTDFLGFPLWTTCFCIFLEVSSPQISLGSFSSLNLHLPLASWVVEGVGSKYHN